LLRFSSPGLVVVLVRVGHAVTHDHVLLPHSTWLGHTQGFFQVVSEDCGIHTHL